MDDHRRTNRDNWDSRVGIHYGSDVYGIERFISDPKHISGVVAFDSKHLEVIGKRLIHLQCHIGTDTISWARLGAEVVGTDFSEHAISAARKLSSDAATPARFEVVELYDTNQVLEERFDIVYTGVGAICWLPDIRGWARVVSDLLEPGGTFYMREAHPVLWALDYEDSEGKLSLIYSYFEGEPNSFSEESTYAGEGLVTSPQTYDWNHGLGETLSALIDSGLRIDHIAEHEFCEWQALDEMFEDAEGHWRLPAGRPRIPLMWTVIATKL